MSNVELVGDGIHDDTEAVQKLFDARTIKDMPNLRQSVKSETLFSIIKAQFGLKEDDITNFEKSLNPEKFAEIEKQDKQ